MKLSVLSFAVYPEDILRQFERPITRGELYRSLRGKVWRADTIRSYGDVDEVLRKYLKERVIEVLTTPGSRCDRYVSTNLGQDLLDTVLAVNKTGILYPLKKPRSNSEPIVFV